MTVPANRSGLFGSRMRWTYVVARRAAQPKGRAELWAGGVQLILPLAFPDTPRPTWCQAIGGHLGRREVSCLAGDYTLVRITVDKLRDC